jgi:hypothetical protein
MSSPFAWQYINVKSASSGGDFWMYMYGKPKARSLRMSILPGELGSLIGMLTGVMLKATLFV